MDAANGTERLLGALIQRITNVEESIARVEKQADERHRKWEDIEKGLRDEVQHLRDFTIEVKGGRRVLIALMAVASGIGALVWDIVRRSFLGS